MNIIFMRHGESTDNVKKLISDKEIYWSILTPKGKKTVLESIKKLPNTIDKIYVSPLPRTIETAHMVYQKYSNNEFIIDNRIREISYGKYSGKPNNSELDNVRLKQIDGDYFTRFGEYGENKFEIESRLCSFLKEVNLKNDKNSTILIISHGSVMSYIKRMLELKSKHLSTGEIEIFTDINLSKITKYQEKLENKQII